MPPSASILAALEVVMSEIQSGAVSDDFFTKTIDSRTYIVPQEKWTGGALRFATMGLSSPVPPNNIGYQITFGRDIPYKYVVYVDNPFDNVAINRRAVLGGYHQLMTTSNTGLMMITVKALDYQ